MKISADFTVIPDDFAKAAAPEYFNGGVPVVSFPFYIDDVDPEARYLHWEFVDPDSIPVCGFEWIHWSVANLPIDACVGHPAGLLPSAAGHDSRDRAGVQLLGLQVLGPQH